jgi:ABC transporter transmembrane region
VQEGQIVEEGSHDALFSNTSSAYHALVKLQQQAMDKRADADFDSAMTPNENVMSSVPGDVREGLDAARDDDDDLVQADRIVRASVPSPQYLGNPPSTRRGTQNSSVRSLSEGEPRGTQDLDAVADDKKGELVRPCSVGRWAIWHPCLDCSAPSMARLRCTHAACWQPLFMLSSSANLCRRAKSSTNMAQTEEEKAVKVGYKRLLGLVARDWPFIISGCLTSAILGCVMPLFAIILSTIIGALNPHEPESKANKWAIGFFGLGVGMLIMAAIQGFSFAIVGAKLAQRVREMFYRSVLYMEVAWFDQARPRCFLLQSTLAFARLGCQHKASACGNL